MSSQEQGNGQGTIKAVNQLIKLQGMRAYRNYRVCGLDKCVLLSSSWLGVHGASAKWLIPARLCEKFNKASQYYD